MSLEHIRVRLGEPVDRARRRVGRDDLHVRPAGNLHVVEQASGQRTTSIWDDQNRQTRVLLPAGGIVTSAYRFDGLRDEKLESEGVTK